MRALRDPCLATRSPWSSRPNCQGSSPTRPSRPRSFRSTIIRTAELIALGQHRRVILANAETGKEVHRLDGISDVARGVAFSRDGKLIAAGSGLPGRGGEITIWEVESQRQIQAIEGHSDTVYEVAFSPAGKMLASSSYDKTVKLWDVESGAELRTLEDHIDAVYTLEFTADGRWLISGSADRSLKIWIPSTGERLYTLSEPLEGINSIAIHPSGRRVVAGGNDRTIRIWELSDSGGEMLNSLIAHQSAILRVAFSPDGETLVTTSADKTIKVFDAGSLDEIATIDNQPDWVMSLDFAPDGGSFAAGRFDGSLSIYKLDNFRDQVGSITSREVPTMKRTALKKTGIVSAIAMIATALVWANPVIDHPTGNRTTPPTIESIEPLGIARGVTQELTVEGYNLRDASEIFFSESTVKGRILEIKELPDVPEPERLGAGGLPSRTDLGPQPPRYQLTVEVDIDAEADPGPVRFRFETPLGTSPAGKFLIEPYYGERPDAEPNQHRKPRHEDFSSGGSGGYYLAAGRRGPL